MRNINGSQLFACNFFTLTAGPRNSIEKVEVKKDLAGLDRVVLGQHAPTPPQTNK